MVDLGRFAFELMLVFRKQNNLLLFELITILVSVEERHNFGKSLFVILAFLIGGELLVVGLGVYIVGVDLLQNERVVGLHEIVPILKLSLFELLFQEIEKFSVVF